MCTSIVEIVRVEGMAKRGDEWFPLAQAVVAYDHARHALLDDVITLDFINTGLEPGAQFAPAFKLALLVSAEFEEYAPGFGEFVGIGRAKERLGADLPRRLRHSAQNLFAFGTDQARDV